MCVVAVAAGCSDVGDASDLGTPPPAPNIVIGAGPSPVDRIAARLYAGALGGSGGRVTVRDLTGAADAGVSAVEAGSVSVTPAASADLLRRYLGRGGADPASLPTVTGEWDGQYVRLAGVLPDGLGAGDPTPAVDQPMLYARPGGASKLADCAQMRGAVAVPGGAKVSAVDGAFGCGFSSVLTVATADDAARAVLEGRADAARLGSLQAPSSVSMLSDDEGRLPANRILPLFRRSGVNTTQARALNAVAGELTTSDLAAMTVRVAAGQSRPGDEAAAWLQAHPLR